MFARLRSPGFWLTLAVIAAAGVYFAVTRWLGPMVEAVRAERREITQTVVATGRVITPARIELGAIVVGTVAEIRAREGERVEAGAALATLRDDEQRAAVAQARAALAEAEARIAQLGKLAAPVADQSLRQAEANLGWARDELDRAKRLAAQGFFSSAKVDEAERNLAIARAARDAAIAQVATNRPQGADYALARARRVQAQAALEAAQSRLKNMVITTPVAGVVLKRDVEPGDVVQAGRTLFEVAAEGGTQIVLQVDEKNLSLLRVDMPGMALADAYPGKRFEARIFYIAPGIDAQRGTVEVKLRVPEPPPFLRPDMTVSVEIEAGRAENATVLPSESIREAAGATPWVMVVRDGRAVRQPVRLGLRGSGRTQVLEGIEAGELVVPPSVNVVLDARVRAREASSAAGPALKAQEIFR